MKKVNATFNVENDLQEHKLWVTLEGLGGKYIKTLPNTDHLKDDVRYKELRKQVKIAKDSLYDYVSKNRI